MTKAQKKEHCMKDKWKIAVQTVLFIAIFLAVLLPVSYMVRTNGDVKERFA